ncbi:zinc-finger domain-containing protein [Neoehrlichia mikurensis]|uniref:Zinc-finger domain-containing protein n=1 Tax=Neoehrlichia mikurensis TaxID=89586 RepID=A0A9Q9F5L8_9RICK|nr:zinc-finger domain-containing protein [Neoehrlichia mikurensis]QXK91607.1 zinc-finger domain-containing protein [Neoehrlichia mikurensis]QXK92818.1 zinc-finger domain-containing protein [Neoehrlichia mikurensis]QXK93297.1 zinc-finger domain-containing protein [Neoehrlichia mikurensis]UTO55761.1 zinc-finger domain-containing protein [Neoehrlichia mikurensis]UTO56678.1 zinc-finger domain-containing protein [Neoehrlichia mikurensis]
MTIEHSIENNQRKKVVWCSGKGDDDNYVEHPKIYLTLTKEKVVCPYCSKVFFCNEN